MSTVVFSPVTPTDVVTNQIDFSNILLSQITGVQDTIANVSVTPFVGLIADTLGDLDVVDIATGSGSGGTATAVQFATAGGTPGTTYTLQFSITTAGGDYFTRYAQISVANSIALAVSS